MSTVQPGGSAPSTAGGRTPARAEHANEQQREQNLEHGTVMVDRYRLTRPTTTDLADAEVWEAQDQILDRPVRVTFVGGEHAASALDAARRAALVSDPRLARVLDVGTARVAGRERGYVITEPYVGSTLTEIVSGGLVDTQQARALVGEAAVALDAAARRGVHHLALRPEAVRVDGNRVVVTGLGLDAGLAGVEGVADDGAASDARDLAALAYYALTARWAGDSLDEPWISADTVRPLPAQEDEHGVVPLSTVVPHVDAELDALVRRTLGAGTAAGGTSDDGPAPASPAEVADALRPWGKVSLAAAQPAPAPAQPAPGVPVRTSVRGSGPAVPVRRPAGGRIARAGAGVAAGAGLGAAAGPAAATAAWPGGPAGNAAVPPPPPPAAPSTYGPHYGGYPTAAFPTGAHGTQPQAPQGGPGHPGGGQPYGAQPYGTQPGTEGSAAAPPPPPGGPSGFSSQPVPRRRGVNPTPIVLGIVIVCVVLGAGWALRNAFTPFEPPIGDPSAAASAPADASAEAQPPAEGSAAPTEQADPEVRPVISDGDQLDPQGGEHAGEHPEAVDLAFDGDPSTFWYTRQYASPQFGGLKDGVGYVIRLREPAPVTQISLATNSQGGHVEVRKTSGDAPTEGPVLAEGSFGPTVDLTFAQPEVGDSFVLWITELPQTNGKNYLELDEIIVQ